MSSRSRKTRGKTRHGRSHHKLTEPRLSKDETGTFHLRHCVNPETGMYRGKQVLDVESKKRKKLARLKDKARERGEDPAEIDEADVLEPDQSVRG